ncbi:hypothetical protein JYT61_00910, partial [bacterium AH-315-E10]|nr:hypothetical protein [bacterium AH-315-E10]
MKQNKNILFVGLVCILVFTFSVYNLLNIQIESGDIYPEYSSLRADPMGSKLLYESLESIPDIKTKRNIDNPSKLTVNEPTIVFFANFNFNGISSFFGEPLDMTGHAKMICASGGTILIMLNSDMDLPEIEKDESETEEDDETESTETQRKKDDKKEVIEFGLDSFSKDANSIFTFRIRCPELNDDDVIRIDTVHRQANHSDLPQTLPWHSNLYFDELNDIWTPLYSAEDRVVMMQRPFLKGRIIICSDSFFLSNESMWKERQVDLIRWMIGDSTQIIFDEYHLGIQQQKGVATLARKYNLFGLFFALIVFAIIYIWKNMIHFIPPNDAESIEYENKHEQGKDSDSA